MEDQKSGQASWRPDGRFKIDIGSYRGITDANERSIIPIEFDGLSSTNTKIQVSGSQCETLSLYRFKSLGACHKRPKPNVDLITVHFVTSGKIDFRCKDREAIGTTNVAVMASFSELIEFEASKLYSVIGAAFSSRTLINLEAALSGDDTACMPAFSLSAEIRNSSLRALFCTMKSAYEQSQISDLHGDQTFRLVEEIIGYQLLSAWPRDIKPKAKKEDNIYPDHLRIAIDYIEENISSELILSDIAASSGISVRALQDNFRSSLGQTPFQYIIDKRLMYVHKDLINKTYFELSIRAIAGRWGFVHASDFGRRYRLKFGCTPTETREAVK